MKSFPVSFLAETLKIRKSNVFWLSILFFVFVSAMMGLLMFIQIHPEISGKFGIVGTKAPIMRFGEPGWINYTAFLNQAIVAIGAVGYGFVASWIFGREFSDKTIKDILALPVSRSYIILTKFTATVIWCIILSIIFFATSIGFGRLAGIPGWSGQIILKFAKTYTEVSLLSILLCTPVAFLASYGRGYLLPFAFIILTLMLANFSGLVGLGPYFPWAIPGILSTPPTEDMKLNTASYFILILTSVSGYFATLAFWRFADHK